MRKRTKAIVIGLAAAALLGCLGYVWLGVSVSQGFSNPVLVVLPVPGSPGAELWLLREGFQERDAILYVRSPSINNGKPMKIAALDSDNHYFFSKLQWSQDGQFAVFSIRLIGENDAEVNAFAYDFSSWRVVLPEWQQGSETPWETPAEWQEHEKTIAALAAAHGGMSGDVSGWQDFQAHARKLWYWQVPK